MPKSFAAWPGFAEIQAKIDQLVHLDPTPILPALERAIADDNRRGVLAGLDADGDAMPITLRQQSGKGPQGPPLAPRGTASRSIANLATAWYQDGPATWIVFGAWEDVLSKAGVPFLPFHFRGEGRLPVRDLAGLRPDGMAAAAAVVDAWVSAQLESGGTAPAPASASAAAAGQGVA